MRIKMSKQPPPALTASAVGSCPAVIQIVGHPSTGSLTSIIAPPDHPLMRRMVMYSIPCYFVCEHLVGFSLYRAISHREGERGKKGKMRVKIPIRTYCKRSRPLPYCNSNCRTPRHWKFTQHHPTTRPSPVCEELQ